jgi:drug/metabolite transporter (DMT)-like permease
VIQSQAQTQDAQSWAMLLILSVIWGASFMFIAVAVKELAPLQIVLARVAIAATLLLPIHFWRIGALPRDKKVWAAAGGMSIMNNILPFTLIVWGQQFITGGLASVINATTPFFALMFLTLFGLEAVNLRKGMGLAVGLAGVVLLKGGAFGNLSDQSLGIFAVLAASCFYGLSAPWSKVKLQGIPPLTTATLQLLLSTLGMLFITSLFGGFEGYANASLNVWATLFGLAALSTSAAYLLFFNIIERAGPAFVSLVTMIIPVSAILMGYAFLGEQLTLNEVAGATVIGFALLIIDGRLLTLFGVKLA